MTRRVLVTASRKWFKTEPIWDALEEQYRIAQAAGESLVVVHGRARGGDMLARRWAHMKQNAGYQDVSEDSNPADWEKYGRAAGHIRNKEMVNKGADVCLAFPLPDSIGTVNCMKDAERAGIPVIDLGER